MFFATLFILISSVKVNGINAFSWHAVHIEFATISQYPEDLLLGAYSTYATTIYLYPVYSFSFFVFFGFGEEAIQEYMARWSQLRESARRLLGKR